MELGEKLRAARLEAGLSQRQLCEGIITRNMLSQLEHGSAKPSMGTLTALADRLGKPISFFLGEDGNCTPNLARMTEARAQFDRGDFAAARETLAGYQPPDPIFDREFSLLSALVFLNLAEAAVRDHRPGRARELLDQAASREAGAYCEADLRRRRLLLLARLDKDGWKKLPSLDPELLLRAQGALEDGSWDLAAGLLEAVQDRGPRWHLLRGQCRLAGKHWQEAAEHLHKAEAVFPAETPPLLEICYRELGDFRRAYEYACKQKNG